MPTKKRKSNKGLAKEREHQAINAPIKEDHTKHSAQLTMERHSGPLPSPEVLARYGDISADLPERIVAMAEVQARHRQDIEAKTTIANIELAHEHIRQETRGQRFALTIAVLAIVATGFCAYFNQPIPATAIGGGTLAAMVVAFLRKDNPKEN